MQNPIRDHHNLSSKAEFALALTLYREEQEKMKSMVRKALDKYGKPRLTLMELRATLDAQLGSISLSQEIIVMREEGY
jgi:hypothetical protein